MEGESDSQTLWYHYFPALGLPGADSWQEEWADYLIDFDAIYVVDERDHGGEAIRKWLKKSSIRDRVRLLTLGEHKDPSALHVADSDGFEPRMRAFIESAIPDADRGGRASGGGCRRLQCRR